MAELLDVMDAFSSPLKLAWGVWLAWGIGQIFWYRQERQASTPSRPARVAKPAPEPRPTPEAAMAASASAVTVPIADSVSEPEVTTSEVPTVPEPVAPEPAAAAPLAPPAEPEPKPAFDPTQAVVETFGQPAGEPTPEPKTGGDLDSFVASLRREEPADQERPIWPDA